jgi:hypothetical protein
MLSFMGGDVRHREAVSYAKSRRIGKPEIILYEGWRIALKSPVGVELGTAVLTVD